MLEQALRGMDDGELKYWVKNNGYDEMILEGTTLQVAEVRNNNYDEGTIYKGCVKGDWWEFWKDDEDVPCVKIKAHGYADYEPNFCYEKKWDKASKAEVALFAGEVVAGTAAAIVTGAGTGGLGSWAAYCGTTTAVSAGGAWLLAGTMANDKWPHGIDQ